MTIKFGGIAQLARASALHAEGHRFESVYLHSIFTTVKMKFEIRRLQEPSSMERAPQIIGEIAGSNPVASAKSEHHRWWQQQLRNCFLQEAGSDLAKVL